MDNMRDLMISKLTEFISNTDGYGIPAYFDCDEEETIKDPAVLKDKTNEELLEIFEATVGFGG